MAKRNRQPEQQHRVYRLPEDLRDRVKRARKKDGQTIAAFILTAVESQLPGPSPFQTSSFPAPSMVIAARLISPPASAQLSKRK